MISQADLNSETGLSEQDVCGDRYYLWIHHRGLVQRSSRGHYLGDGNFAE